MVCSRYEFLDGVVFVTDVQWGCCKLYWLVYVLYHLLSSQVIVIACEVHNTIYAICEHCVVVTCRYQIHRMIQLYCDWDALRAFSPQCSFVVATKSISLSISSQNYWMKTSASNLVHALLEQGIGVYFTTGIPFIFRIFLVLVLVIFISEVEFFDVSEANWSLGFRQFAWMPELIGLTRSVNVELHEQLLFRLLGFLLWFLGSFYFFFCLLNFDLRPLPDGLDLDFDSFLLHLSCWLILRIIIYRAFYFCLYKLLVPSNPIIINKIIYQNLLKFNNHKIHNPQV